MHIKTLYFCFIFSGIYSWKGIFLKIRLIRQGDCFFPACLHSMDCRQPGLLRTPPSSSLLASNCNNGLWLPPFTVFLRFIKGDCRLLWQTMYKEHSKQMLSGLFRVIFYHRAWPSQTCFCCRVQESQKFATNLSPIVLVQQALSHLIVTWSTKKSECLQDSRRTQQIIRPHPSFSLGNS